MKMQVRTSTVGAACALAAVFSTALYQLWAGSKQKDLGASSAQLLHQSSAYAVLLLMLLVAIFEPIIPGALGEGAFVIWRFPALRTLCRPHVSPCVLHRVCMLPANA